MAKNEFLSPEKKEIKQAKKHVEDRDVLDHKPNKKKTALFLKGRQKKAHISAYILADLKFKIERLAKENNCSESSVVEECLLRFLKNY